MFNQKPQPEPSKLDEAIDDLFAELKEHKATDEDYSKISSELERLYKIKTDNTDKGSRISPDALVAVLGNLVGIVAILGYERVNVVTSKALGFVLKSKLH